MRLVKLDVGMLTHDLMTIPAYARKVEALGFDGLWSSETQHDPFLPLAVAATATSRIKLGTAIAVAFPRSPMVTAHMAWDLQKASGAPVLPPLVHRSAAQDVYLAALKQGDGEYYPMWSGQSVGLIHDLPGAAEVVEKIVREARAVLEGLAKLRR